jgi:glycosyltransferase involved in cell wall biosynthesis
MYNYTDFQPFLSVVIPAYNAGKHIKLAIDSIPRLPNINIEIIVVNDGSSDKTHETVAELCKHDPRIIYLKQHNLGVGVARNTGLELAQGKYTSFLDSDDVYDSAEFAKSLNLLVNCSVCADIYCTGFKMISSDNVLVSMTEYRSNIYLYPLHTQIKKPIFKDVVWNKFYKSEFLKNNKIKFPDLRVKEDSVFTLTVLARAKNLITVPHVIYLHKSGNDSSLSNSFDFNSFQLGCQAILQEKQIIQKLEPAFSEIHQKLLLRSYLYLLLFTIHKSTDVSFTTIRKNSNFIKNFPFSIGVGMPFFMASKFASLVISSTIMIRITKLTTNLLKIFHH